MSFTLRRVFPLPAFLILATSVFPPQSRAQAVEKSAAAAPTNAASTEPSMPTRRTGQTANNDPIALIAAHQQDPASGHSADSDAMRNVSAKEISTAPGQAQNKPETIAGIESLIAEKQKRIALLMRLFVDDERAFLNDPTNTNVDPNVHDRRKYEQDELLFESSEIARLRAKAQELRSTAQKH